MEQTKKQNGRQKNGQEKYKAGFDSAIYGIVPPQARDLEKAVLGAILLEQSAFSRVTDILTADSFYVETHQTIFRSCYDLQKRGSPIDILTVMDDLGKKGELEAVGGPYALTVLTNEVVGSSHIEYHAMIVQEKYVKRELIKIGQQITMDAYSDAGDTVEITNWTEAQLFKLAHNNNVTAYQSATDLAVDNLKQIEALQNRTIDLTGVPSGFGCLDKLTCGWQQPDLIILAARPSVGKTAFALNLAVHAAQRKVGVGMFSLEMSAKQLAARAVSYISQVDLDKISRGRMDREQLKKYYAGNAQFSDLNFMIDDTASINIHQLRTKARQMVNKNKVGLIIVDYLQLMSGEVGKNGNREQEISTISRGLKGMAKELQIPVIALSQLSRSIEDRKGGEPRLADLRESGAIEQDADLVGFLMRDDYGLTESEKPKELSNKAWLKILKHRNGTLEKLAFSTDLSTQTWKEFDGFNTTYRKVTPDEQLPF